MGLTQEQQQALNKALETTKTRGLVREPVMITLPIATLAATVIYKLLGGASPLAALFGAFVVSIVLYVIDLTTLTPDERAGGNTLLRLGYVVINTLLLTGLLMGIISPEQLGLGGGG